MESLRGMAYLVFMTARRLCRYWGRCLLDRQPASQQADALFGGSHRPGCGAAEADPDPGGGLHVTTTGHLAPLGVNGQWDLPGGEGLAADSLDRESLPRSACSHPMSRSPLLALWGWSWLGKCRRRFGWRWTAYPRMSNTDSAMAWPSSGGTALPICFAIWVREPENEKSSSND